LNKNRYITAFIAKDFIYLEYRIEVELKYLVDFTTIFLPKQFLINKKIDG
jgi:hypothetical protein